MKKFLALSMILSVVSGVALAALEDPCPYPPCGKTNWSKVRPSKYLHPSRYDHPSRFNHPDRYSVPAVPVK